MFWNETGSLTGLSDKILNNKTVLIGLYNPGANGNLPIKIRVPSHELNIFNEKNQTIHGDIFCPNLQNTLDCELLFHLEINMGSNAYVKLIPTKTSPSAKVIPLK